MPDWLKPGWLLGLFALIFIFLLAFTYEQTRERIAIQEQLRLEAQLKEILVAGSYDNEPATDVLEIEGDKRTVYRARLQGQPVAALFKTVAKDGYSGSINLLVGIKPNGELLGVRALAHRETPGLGDEIDLRRSDWVLDFAGRSLRNPMPDDWAVKKDGGVFDAFTGATITPRAVVGEVKKTLIYFQAHQHELFQ
ncbi:MAG: electron transport complex subunit RsxG [Gammaproteobacteria bacterium]|nr:electron transport complex subunit RsxG [Gammaproteobacteria bacterium]